MENETDPCAPPEEPVVVEMQPEWLERPDDEQPGENCTTTTSGGCEFREVEVCDADDCETTEQSAGCWEVTETTCEPEPEPEPELEPEPEPDPDPAEEPTYDSYEDGAYA